MPQHPGHAALAALWRQRPDANLCLLTGKRSGVIVADIDPRRDGCLDTLWQLGWPKETVIAQSGSGGWHVYAVRPPDGLPNVDAYAEGVEIKADGKLVVLPPSLHASGNSYRWLDGHSPDEIAGAALPETVLAAIRHQWHTSNTGRGRGRGTGTGRGTGAVDMALVEGIDIGWSRTQVRARAMRFYRRALWRVCKRGEGRNTTLFWLSGQLFALGFSGEEVLLWADAFTATVGTIETVGGDA